MESVSDQYPPIVRSALEKMDDKQRMVFQQEYDSRQRASRGMIILSIVFPIQLFLLGRTGLGIAFLLTGGGFFIWWIVEIFLTPRRVKTYNAELATTIARDMTIMT